LKDRKKRQTIISESVKMAIDIAAVQKFKGTLSEKADVVTKESENYEHSLKRWSAAAEKPAVSEIILRPSRFVC